MSKRPKRTKKDDKRARMLRRVTDIYHGAVSGWLGDDDSVLPCQMEALWQGVTMAFNIEDEETLSRLQSIIFAYEAETPEKLTDKLLSWGVKP